MEKRQKKQIIIILTYLFFIVFISAAIFFVFKVEYTCFDKIKNQGEFETDCGGPCQPCPEKPVLKELEIVSTEWVYDIDSKYDVAVKIKNPNSLYGLKTFKYAVSIMGADNALLQKTGLEEGFILPGEEKYLLVQGLKLPSEPGKIAVEFSSTDWQGFTDYEKPNFLINNKQYDVITGGTAGFSRAKGTLINNSPYDFEHILVKILLRDGQGKLLAVNHQQMNVVRSKEQRDYDTVFPHSFPGSVGQVEVEPEVNVFSSDNYLKVKGQPETWDRTR